PSIYSLSLHDALPILAYWIFNDACPPSPGCSLPRQPLPTERGGVRYATIWQYARSPRVKELTTRCAATYSTDGNCYAPSDSAHADRKSTRLNSSHLVT